MAHRGKQDETADALGMRQRQRANQRARPGMSGKDRLPYTHSIERLND
jgi:hypothetical protein